MKNSKSEYRYETIASDLRKDIVRGIFISHNRMPSLRSISAQYAVSMSTAIQAYDLLHSEGLIEARPKSGYYVAPQASMVENEPESIAPLAIPTEVTVGQLAMSLVHESRAKKLAKLGAAVPSSDLLPLGILSRTMSGVARRMWKSPGVYEDSQGHIELRRQICKLMKDAGCQCHPDDIVITNGALEALALALRAIAKSNDIIAIESPTYFGVLQVIEKLGMQVIEIRTHASTGIDVHALEAVLKQTHVSACVLMPNVSNPLGSVMPETNKQLVVEMLAKYNVPLIEDDVFGALSYQQPRPKAAKAYDKNNTVLFCSSFSKLLAPGYRIGWIVPGIYKDQVRYQKFLDNISTAIITQLTLAEFIARDSYKRYIKSAVKIYQQRMDQLRKWVSQYFPAGTKFTNPQGGMLLWVELPETINGLELYSQAMAKHIAISPGILFSARQQYTHYIRLSCGTLEGNNALNAVKKVGSIASKLAKS